MIRCVECPQNSRYVPSYYGGRSDERSNSNQSPLQPSILFIGDRPIIEHNRPSLMSAQTFIEFSRTYLQRAKLDYSSVSFANAICCTDGSKHKPSDKLIHSCAQTHIPQEIKQCNPQTIVLLGAAACSLVPEIQLDRDHGLPILSSNLPSLQCGCFSDWSGTLVPMYHPALGLKSTDKMIPLLEDFERLAGVLKGTYSHEISPARFWPTDYRLADAGLVRREVAIRSRYRFLPIDTEDDEGRAWSLQYSLYPGHGRCLLLDAESHKKDDCVSNRRTERAERAERADTLAAFQSLVDQFEGVTMHNAAHDLGVLDELGIEVDSFRDTMQEAYHLGNLPQGLKALAWRLMATPMQSWDDLVTPPARRLLEAWLMERIVECEPEIEIVPYKRPFKRNGVLVDHKRVVKQSAREKMLAHVYKHGFGKTTSDYDVWGKLAEFGVLDIVERTPRKSIAHCPIDEAVAYSCADADNTGQLAEVLALFRRQLAESDWAIPQSDWDK